MKRILAGRWRPREFAPLTAAIAVAGAGVAGPGRRVLGAVVGAVVPSIVALSVSRRAALGSSPADAITFVRAGLAGCACAAALAPPTASEGLRTWAVAGFAIPALALDAVDGPVARATGTDSPAGARLDMQTDAAALFMLSTVATRVVTPWAAGIGAARYVFVAGSLLRPAWAGELPPSRRRRAVAGLQGVVLSVALAPVVPLPIARGLVIGGAIALAGSFGRDIWLLERRAARQAGSTRGGWAERGERGAWLRRHRDDDSSRAATAGERRRSRREGRVVSERRTTVGVVA